MSAANSHSAGEAELVLRPERKSAVVGGQEVIVTATQFRLLSILANSPGRVFTRAELVQVCIGTLVSERTVDVHVAELRRKLGSFGSRIETVRRAGYRFRGET
jgi:DNA-binding response OmpR family regulator